MNQNNHLNQINHSSDVDFESMWQYGTAENGPNPHPAWQREGVAPQCAIPGLNWNVPSGGKYGRIRFKGKADFVRAHVGASYGWVISKITNPQSNGYVIKR